MARLLEQDIEDLQALDVQRERCVSLIESAARALITLVDRVQKARSNSDESWSDQDWDSAKDDVERAMARRSLIELESAAKALVNRVQKARSNSDESWSDQDWDSAKDDVERAMVLRSLNLIDRNSLLSPGVDRNNIDAMAHRLREHLLKTSLDSLYKKRSERENDDIDQIPAFRACHIIQALVEDGDKTAGPFCTASLNCLYLLLTEVYRAEDPEWKVGGVRASRESPPSAFVTREAVRSILVIRDSLVNTKRLLDELSRAKKEWTASELAPSCWRAQISGLRRSSFKTSLQTQWPHLLNRYLLNDLMNGTDDDWAEKVCSDVAQQLHDQWNRLGTHLQIFRQMKLKTTAPSPVREGEGPSPDQAVEGLSPDQGGEDSLPHQDNEHPVSPAIHLLVTKLLDGIYTAANEPLDGKLKDLDGWSDTLKSAAAGVLRIVKPADVYLESILVGELSTQPSRTTVSPDAAQASFAAAALAEIARASDRFDAEDLRLQAATELASSRLSERGVLPSQTAWDVAGKGYRLPPQNAEKIRAICDMLRFSTSDCSPDSARRLVRYFVETRAVQPEKHPGWHSDAEPGKAKGEIWATALAFVSLLDLRMMLDEQINRRVLRHFTARHPDELKLTLDQLFLPDTMSALVNEPGKSIGAQLEEMRAHVEGIMSSGNDFSLVLYGPPGTGKSTLVEAVARSARSEFVEITPSDILIGGREQIERHTRMVFSALSMLTKCVILFDEFDSILRTRSLEKDRPIVSEFQFLTPGLLPKLKRLHDRAAKQRLAYALATNYVGDLDSAAIRSGRFDRPLGIFPPDYLSRVSRLATEMRKWKYMTEMGKYSDEKVEPDKGLGPKQLMRAIEVVSNSAGYGMATLGKPGRFTEPRPDTPLPGTLFGYIFFGDKPDLGDKEAERPTDQPPIITPTIGLREWHEWGVVDKLDKRGGSIQANDWRTYVEKIEAVDWKAYVREVGETQAEERKAYVRHEQERKRRLLEEGGPA